MRDRLMLSAAAFVLGSVLTLLVVFAITGLWLGALAQALALTVVVGLFLDLLIPRRKDDDEAE